MKVPTEAKLLRVFVGEAERFEGRPLYEAIVHLARERGLAGATVMRGVMGFGADSRLHTAKILRLSEDLPMVIEIVDKAERIEGLLREIDGMIKEGMVTVETVTVFVYGHNSERGG